MPYTITLKKLRNAIKAIEQDRHIPVPANSLSISYHDSFDNAYDNAVFDLSLVFKNTIEKNAKLFELRNLVDQANHSSGISVLINQLTQHQNLLASLKLFKGLSSVSLADFVLKKAEFNFKAGQVLSGAVIPSGYGDREFTFHGFVPEDFLQEVAKEIKEATNTYQDIQDKLTYQNSSYQVVISDDLYEYIKDII